MKRYLPLLALWCCTLLLHANDRDTIAFSTQVTTLGESYATAKLLGRDISPFLLKLGVPLHKVQIFNLLGQQCMLSSADLEQNKISLYIVRYPLFATAALPDSITATASNLNATPYSGQLSRHAPATGPCDWDKGRIDSFTTELTSVTPCPGNTITPAMLDSALTAHGGQYYSPVALGADMPLSLKNRKTVEQILAAGFKQLPQPAAMSDSLKVVVNFVYVIYTYAHHANINSSNIDSIFMLLETGALAGDCGNNTHYANLIISTYFPWWGTVVELNSNTDTTTSHCSVSHVFNGLSNVHGKINYVFDCTVNALWCDSLTGLPLSLDTLIKLLRDPNQYFRVVKQNANYYGDYNRGIGDLACACVTWLMFPESVINLQTARFVPPLNTFVVISPWQQFDLLSETNDQYYWQQLGFPANTWANNILTIKFGYCGKPVISNLIWQNYGFQVYPLL